MNRKDQLAAAFEAGKNAARRGNGLSERFQHRGKCREFFEAAYFKESRMVAAEREAYYDSPEYRALEKRRLDEMRLLAAAMIAADTGRTELAREYLNAALTK